MKNSINVHNDIIIDSCSFKKLTGRNKTLDIYKGVLIILVVLRHVLQYSVTDEGGVLTNFIWAVQMPGFMLVAGYFSARKVESLKLIRQRILLSTQYYALPFFSWLFLINCFLLGGDDRNPIITAIKTLTRIDRALWFLWVVFILSIVATLCNYALSLDRWRFQKAGIVLIIFFLVLGSLGLIFDINLLGIKYILYYSVFYGFGWLAHWTKARWRQCWEGIADSVVAIAMAIFLAIIYNYNLYQAPDNLIGITLRCVSGFTGNLVLFWVCEKYKNVLDRVKFDYIGMYTLEIYVTHMYVNSLMIKGKTNTFYSVPGFFNFLISLMLTVLFTALL